MATLSLPLCRVPIVNVVNEDVRLAAPRDGPPLRPPAPVPAGMQPNWSTPSPAGRQDCQMSSHYSICL